MCTPNWQEATYEIDYYASDTFLGSQGYVWTDLPLTVTAQPGVGNLLDVYMPGYKFDGWCDTEYWNDNSVCPKYPQVNKADTPETQPVTTEFWAKYTPIQYNIRYDLNNGNTLDATKL